MIWGCGRDGKLFYKTLRQDNQLKVTHFCEINPQKVNTSVILNQTSKHKIPIIHWSEVLDRNIINFKISFLSPSPPSLFFLFFVG